MNDLCALQSVFHLKHTYNELRCGAAAVAQRIWKIRHCSKFWKLQWRKQQGFDDTLQPPRLNKDFSSAEEMQTAPSNHKVNCSRNGKVRRKGEPFCTSLDSCCRYGRQLLKYAAHSSFLKVILKSAKLTKPHMPTVTGILLCYKNIAPPGAVANP